MAQIMLFKKFLYGFLFIGALPPVAQILQHSIGWLPTSVAICLMLITVLPEASLTSKDFRMWIKEGIEDADGKLNSVDLARFLGYYGTFCVFRAFIFGYLMAMTGGWNPEPSILYAPLVAAGGSGALAFVNKKRTE